jgi:hypothetical protein
LIHCLEEFFVWWGELHFLHCEVFVKVRYVMIRFLWRITTFSSQEFSNSNPC